LIVPTLLLDTIVTVKDIPSVLTDTDINSLALLEPLVIVDKETNAILLALTPVKLELLMLKLIVMPDYLISLENKVISAILMLLDFTNASEMLSAHLNPLLDLNSFLAP